MPYVTFRFGRIEREGRGNIPSLSEIESRIEQLGIVGEAGNRRGVRNVVLEADYLAMDFIKEQPSEYVTLDSQNKDKTETVVPRWVMRFLLLENNYYSYESKRDVSDSDALNFLFEPFDFEYRREPLDKLSLETMRKFYKTQTKVRQIKVENIGEREPNPRDRGTALDELIEQGGLFIERSEFSSGHSGRNLKEARIIDDGFADTSDLTKIRAEDRNGEIRELRDSGRYQFPYEDEDEDGQEIPLEDQSREIKRKAMEALRDLFGRI